MRHIPLFDVSAMRFPAVTLLMIVLLVLGFFLQIRVGATASHTFGFDRLSSLFAISDRAIQTGHIARLITASLFHVNVGHLLSNAAGLLVFAGILEMLLGRSRVAIVIILSAAGGAAGSWLFHMVDWMVGSSTILFGVYGGLGVVILTYRRELGRRLVPAAIGWCVTVVLSSTLGYVSLEHVDHGAHIGGFAAGALATFWMVRGRSPAELTGPHGPKGTAVLLALIAALLIGLVTEVAPLVPLLT